MPIASRIVGAMLITLWNWLRMPPRSVMRLGHVTTMPVRVPPRFEATCFVHRQGVSIANAQGTAKWLLIRSVLQTGDQRQHLVDGEGEAVEIGHFVRRAVEGALGAHAIVAADEDDQRVVELADDSV